MKVKKNKTEIIVICGCPIRVNSEAANEFKKKESERLREAWRKNQLD